MKLSILSMAFVATAQAAVRGKRQSGSPDVSDCGLGVFAGHTSEALIFCSNILRSGTATSTVTNAYSTTTTMTTTTTVTVRPSATPKPTPTPTPTPSSSSTLVIPSSTLASSTLVTSPSPTPTGAPSCGLAGYVKTTPAYYFESSGTKNTFDTCSALCKADSKCKSFGYGEANCMLFDVATADNTNPNPTSPYTFYDASCPTELPIRKRSPQLGISLGLPGGIHISIGLGDAGISSACSCLITKGPASKTVTRTVSTGVTKTSTVVSTVTTTEA